MNRARIPLLPLRLYALPYHLIFHTALALAQADGSFFD